MWALSAGILVGVAVQYMLHYVGAVLGNAYTFDTIGGGGTLKR